MYEGTDNIVFINDQAEKDDLSLSELKISMNSDLILDVMEDGMI